MHNVTHAPSRHRASRGCISVGKYPRNIVADGIHVDYGMISIARRLLKEKLYLVLVMQWRQFEAAVQHVAELQFHAA